MRDNTQNIKKKKQLIKNIKKKDKKSYSKSS